MYIINSSLILHLDKNSNSLAYLYFTDEKCRLINIPKNINVYMFDCDNNKILIRPTFKNKYYILSWCESYDIYLNNQKICELSHKISWDIMF
jgi:hypothetical protein